MMRAVRLPCWNTSRIYVAPFPQLHPRLPMSSRVVPLSRVMVADVSSLLTVMSVTYRPFRRAAYSSAALSWLRVALLLVVMACSPIFVFLGVVVWRARLRHCLSARGCAPACCEGEAGAVCAGSVVALCGEEGQLGFVSVDHDENGVFFPPVPDVVFVARVFDVGVHDAGASVASVERAGDVVPAYQAGLRNLLL